jgi:hypothetical protein
MESFSEPLNESNTYFPKSNLEGQFGKSSVSGNGVSGGMLVKEFRMWTEQRSVKQISLYMHSQVDPTIKENSKLLHYLRLASASYKHLNFARFNPNFDFSKARRQPTKLLGDSYIYDYEVRSVW